MVSPACTLALLWTAGAAGYHALPDGDEQVERQGRQCPYKGNYHGVQLSQAQPSRDSQ